MAPTISKSIRYTKKEKRLIDLAAAKHRRTPADFIRLASLDRAALVLGREAQA